MFHANQANLLSTKEIILTNATNAMKISFKQFLSDKLIPNGAITFDNLSGIFTESVMTLCNRLFF